MPAPLFIGDEVSAAGFRLAGVRIRTPENRQELEQLLQWGHHNVSFIMITSNYMSMFSSSQREALLRQEIPPIVEVPDMRAQVVALNLAKQFREKLGVLE